MKSFPSNDIDLLIEYDERLVSISEALKLRVEIATNLKKVFKSEVDICLLSISENIQTKFIVKEKGVLLSLTLCISNGGRICKI